MISAWFFHPGSVLTSWLLWLVGPGEVQGLEHVPREGAYLLVANHTSNLDPPFIGATVGHRTGRVIHFMAKSEIRRWPVVGFLAGAAGVIFVRRGEGDRAAQRLAMGALLGGRPIGIFPEGTRSRDGRLREPKAGAALLATRSGVPILPVAISGTHRIFPGRSRFPHRSRITIRVGPPFSLAQKAHGPLDREQLRSDSERIMRAIAALLPEDQRGRWNEPAAD